MILSIIGLWFGVTGIYVMSMHAKKLRDEGKLNLFWTVNILPWAFVGLILDALFNATAGTVMFASLPRELLFSSRVQRHVLDDSWRGHVARFWKRQLNQIEPNHIK